VPGHPDSVFYFWGVRGVARDIGMEEVKPREPKLDREITDQETIRLLEAQVQQLQQEVAAAARAIIEAQACQAARSACCSQIEAQIELERETLKVDSARQEAQLQAHCAQWEAKQDQLSERLEQHQEQLKQREQFEESLQEQLKQHQQFEESLAVCLVTAIGLLKGAKAEPSCGCKRKRAEDLESPLLSQIRAASDDYMPPSQGWKRAPARVP